MGGSKADDSKIKKRKHKKHLEKESDDSSSGDDKHSSKAEKKSSKHKKHKKKHRKHGSGSDSPDERPHQKQRDMDAALLQEAKSFLEATVAAGRGPTAPTAAPAGNLSSHSAAGPAPPPTGAMPAHGSRSGGSYGPQLPSSLPGPPPTSHQGQGTTRQGPPLTPDDYFLRANEFSNWLKEERHLEFSGLDSQSARTLFEADFSQAWNAGRLDGRYYTGEMGGLRRSSHAWGIKGGAAAAAAAAAGGAAGGGPSTGMRGFLAEEQQRREDSSQQHRVEQKAWRREQKEEREEMAPKATGREAKPTREYPSAVCTAPHPGGVSALSEWIKEVPEDMWWEVALRSRLLDARRGARLRLLAASPSLWLVWRLDGLRLAGLPATSVGRLVLHTDPGSLSRLPRHHRAPPQRSQAQRPPSSGETWRLDSAVAKLLERALPTGRSCRAGGGSLMGGDDSFAAAKAREDRRATGQRQVAMARNEGMMAKVAAFQAKEDDLMAGFRALAALGPITIAKRQ
ncbi:MAG: hypothetical protein WDW38_004850 [Sanguina aurantia]